VLHVLLPTSLVCSYFLDEHSHFIGAVQKIQRSDTCSFPIWNLKSEMCNAKSANSNLKSEIHSLKFEICNLKFEIHSLSFEISHELSWLVIVNYSCYAQDR
jgi:hypothetical protein